MILLQDNNIYKVLYDICDLKNCKFNFHPVKQDRPQITLNDTNMTLNSMSLNFYNILFKLPSKSVTRDMSKTSMEDVSSWVVRYWATPHDKRL